ncbi:MAG TPA: transposase [Verrucomicrobiae bacterium]|nr:transposase [Verrucomicrobiae bacterium]
MRTMTSTSSGDPTFLIPSTSVQNVPVALDSKGRVRASKEQRRMILAEYERSGVSAAQFARQTGMKYSTLAGWLIRYRRSKSQGARPAVRLLEAVVEENSGDKKALVLELPGGARMEIKDVPQAALAGALLRTLAKPC